MRWDVLWRPVGRYPARVYWTRRAVAVTAALLVVVMLAYACSSGAASPRRRAASTPAAAPLATPPAAQPSTPPATVSAAPGGGPGACRASDVTTAVATDAQHYPAGVLPRFSVTVATAARSSCRLSLGGIRIVVLSGSDRIWADSDCPGQRPVGQAVVSPGSPARVSTVWSRLRSALGCPGGSVQALPGTYRVYAALASLVSAPAVFTLG